LGARITNPRHRGTLRSLSGEAPKLTTPSSYVCSILKLVELIKGKEG
jgi:hypothetical protein